MSQGFGEAPSSSPPGIPPMTSSGVKPGAFPPGISYSGSTGTPPSSSSSARPSICGLGRMSFAEKYCLSSPAAFLSSCSKSKIWNTNNNNYKYWLKYALLLHGTKPMYMYMEVISVLNIKLCHKQFANSLLKHRHFSYHGSDMTIYWISFYWYSNICLYPEVYFLMTCFEHDSKPPTICWLSDSVPIKCPNIKLQ